MNKLEAFAPEDMLQLRSRLERDYEDMRHRLKMLCVKWLPVGGRPPEIGDARKLLAQFDILFGEKIAALKQAELQQRQVKDGATGGGVP